MEGALGDVDVEGCSRDSAARVTSNTSSGVGSSLKVTLQDCPAQQDLQLVIGGVSDRPYVDGIASSWLKFGVQLYRHMEMHFASKSAHMR